LKIGVMEMDDENDNIIEGYVLDLQSEHYVVKTKGN